MSFKSLQDLLKHMVAIPSVNPELAEHTEHAGEARMADFVANYLAERGFAIERHEPIAGRPNVIGRFGPAKPRRTILFEGHMDTQDVRGMTVPPFGGIEKDGRIYGRGACDTKGPSAAALWVLEPRLLDELAGTGCEVIYVGAIGEETGNDGARQLVEHGLSADEAVILEPTELSMVIAHKGALWFDVEARGIAAHGSTPSRGINAIVGMYDAIDALRSQCAAAAAAHHHELLGDPTVNFGAISGGNAVNIVAERCVLRVDRRINPSESSAEIFASVEERLRKTVAERRLAGFEVKKVREGRAFATPTGCPLVNRLRAACVGNGAEGRVEGAGWYSDAGLFAATCREVAVFGPGSIAQAHTADEFIAIDSLLKGASILRHYLLATAAELRKS